MSCPLSRHREFHRGGKTDTIPASMTLVVEWEPGNHLKECIIAHSFCALKERNMVLGEKIEISGGGGDASDNGGDSGMMVVRMMVGGRSCEVANDGGE